MSKDIHFLSLLTISPKVRKADSATTLPQSAESSPASESVPSPSDNMQATGQRASTAWTREQDQILMDARAAGLNWVAIKAKRFPMKSPNACRKRHERLMESRRNAEDWDVDKWELLAKEYLLARKDMWTTLAVRTGEKWQLVEAKVREVPSDSKERCIRRIHSVLSTSADLENSAWRKG